MSGALGKIVVDIIVSAQDYAEDAQGHAAIAEIDEHGLGGELPFLPRASAGGGTDFAADVKGSPSDLLPTYSVPPLRRTATGSAAVSAGAPSPGPA